MRIMQNQKGVVGIQNMGNRCYMNSILQFLRGCSSWNLFSTQEWPVEYKLLFAHKDLIQALWSAHYPAYLRPMGFLHELQQIIHGTPYESFGTSTQQDAHEFLVFLLDQFHEATVLKEKEKEEKKEWNLIPYSPLKDMFFGMMRKIVQCHICQQKSYQWELFNVLKIPCQGETLLDWIQSEFSPTTIPDYQCIPCHAKTIATIHTQIWRLPPYLIITFKQMFFFNF